MATHTHVRTYERPSAPPRTIGRTSIFTSGSTRSCSSVPRTCMVPRPHPFQLPSSHIAYRVSRARPNVLYRVRAEVAQSYPQTVFFSTNEFDPLSRSIPGPSCALTPRTAGRALWPPPPTVHGKHGARPSPQNHLRAQEKKASQVAHATLPLHCPRLARAGCQVPEKSGAGKNAGGGAARNRVVFPSCGGERHYILRMSCLRYAYIQRGYDTPLACTM